MENGRFKSRPDSLPPSTAMHAATGMHPRYVQHSHTTLDEGLVRFPSQLPDQICTEYLSYPVGQDRS